MAFIVAVMIFRFHIEEQLLLPYDCLLTWYSILIVLLIIPRSFWFDISSLWVLVWISVEFLGFC